MNVRTMTGLDLLNELKDVYDRHGIDGIETVMKNADGHPSPCMCLLLTGGCSVNCSCHDFEDDLEKRVHKELPDVRVARAVRHGTSR